jgi:uncharacterized membrane protein YfcA
LDVRLTIIGFIVGILVGLSGVGGSALLAPLMILFLGIKPLVAVGTDLAYSVPTKWLGALVHWRQKTVDWRLVRFLVIGGVPSTLFGIALLIFLRKSVGLATLNSILQPCVGALLFLVAGTILLSPLLARLPIFQAKAASGASDPPRKRSVIILGAIVGLSVSLTSIGAGSITLPVLYLFNTRLGLKHLVGSDVAFAAALVPVALLGHLQLGDVNLALSANLVVGSLPGVFIGSRLCAYLPDYWFRPAMAVALAVAGSRLL